MSRPPIIVSWRRTTLLGLLACSLSMSVSTQPATAADLHVPGTYSTIQAAVDAASSGDRVVVASGTYVEQVTITGDLDLIGAGASTTTIQAPAAPRALTVGAGGNTWDYIVAAQPASGTIDVRVEGFTIDAAGELKSTGTAGLVGVLLDNVSDAGGTTAGLHACTIHNFGAVEYDSWGCRVWGDSDLTIDGNTLSGYTRDAIVVNGDAGPAADPVVVVSDNDVTGNTLCLNGIQLSRGATGTVSGNTVRDHTRSSPWAAVGIMVYQSDGVTVGTDNTVDNCFYGLSLFEADNCLVDGNDFVESIAFHIGLDDANGNQISGNTMTDTAIGQDKAVGINNGSTGNTIGGATPSEGNTITMHPSGAGLGYVIYVTGTTGAGSNTVRYNTVTGGKRFVQVDGGNSGTTTVQDNTVSDCSFAGIYLNAGSGVIQRNTMTNTTRPVEFWGASNVTIEENYIDGYVFDAINCGAYTGTVTIHGNAFLADPALAIHNRMTTLIDASGNYLGASDPATVATEVSTYVDYTPWIESGVDQSTDPGFQADLSTLWVDDDSPQTGSSGRIQEGIDLVEGSTVHVGAGTYVEQVTIDKDLDLIGAGATTTIIQAPAAPRALTASAGGNTWDYIVAAQPASGTIDVRVEGFTIDAAGELKSTGTAGLVGALFDDVSDAGGTTAGLHACTIQNFGAVEYDSWGCRVWGASDLTIDGNTLSGYTRDGIVVNGDDGPATDPAVVVSGNDLTGNVLCLNGIQIGRGATGTVSGNTVRDHTRSSPWAAVGIIVYQSNGVMVGSGNTVDNCFYGLSLNQADNCTVAGNEFVESIAFHVGLDDANSNQIAGNTMTDTAIGQDKAVGINNGSTGNMIGGVTPAEGNTIIMHTSGAGLGYVIYVTGTTGAGSNTVRYNTVTGGKRFVQVDGGNSGTTTVQDNTASDCSFAGVYLNAGSGVVQRNTLTNTTRPVEFWGAANVTIEENYIDGYVFDAINCGAYTGTVTIHGNAFLADPALAIHNRMTTLIDASGNYLGASDPATVATEVSTYVDYTPWIESGVDQSTAPGFQADLSTLWVDDDSPQFGTGGIVQEAVDLVDGSTVHIAAGTYPGGITMVAGSPMTLSGAGTTQTFLTGGMLLPDGVTGLTLTQLALSGEVTGGAVIRAGHPNHDFTMDQVLIDGEGATYPTRHAYAGGRTTGDVTITDCEFKNVGGWSVFDCASSGWETVMGTITFTGNYIHECDGAVAFRGDNTDRIDHVIVHDNVWENINDNWNAPGTVQNAWACFEAHGVELLEFHHNTMTNVNQNQWGEGQGLQTWRVGAVDVHSNLFTDCWEGIWLPGLGTEPAPTGSISYNSFVNTADFALSALHGGGGFTSGILDAEMNWWDDASGPAGDGPGTGGEVYGMVDWDPWIGKTGFGNIVCDPDPEYLTATTPVKTIDVEYLGGGSGYVYGYSLRFSWDGAIVSTTTAKVTQGNLLSDLGATQFFVNPGGTNEIVVDCVLLGDQPGVTGPGTMFSIEFTGLAWGTSPIDITVVNVRDRLNNTLAGFYEDDGELVIDVDAPIVANVLISNTTLTHTDDWVKNGDALIVTATVTDDDPAFAGSNIAADLTGLGGLASVAPSSYVAGVATWNVASASCTPSDGAIIVTVTATDPIGNVTTGNDDITADNTLPPAISGFDAAPHHQRVALSWDDPSGGDDNYYGVIVQYDGGGDYPEYATLGTYPADESAGDGTAFNQTGTVTGGDHAIVPRDVYYYQAFAYDWALNYGPADPGARDRATNYWLGDVDGTSGPPFGGDYDGLVGFDDLNSLSTTYFVTNPAVPGNEADVGPTDDGSRLGIPGPDNVVNFEDLMIFAMNFNVVTPTGFTGPAVRLAEAADVEQPALRLVGASNDAGGIDVTLRLEDNRESVKGLSVALEYDSDLLALRSTTMAEALGDGIFVASDASRPGTVLLDLAVLGTGQTLHGSGDLATFRFDVQKGGELAVRFAEATMRGAGNTEIMVRADDLAFGSPLVPTVTRLVGVAPNPFNPSTTIRYDLHEAQQVSLQIYDMSGRLVQTLTHGVQEPGEYRATWDGRDTRGQRAGSGVYLIRMRAGSYDTTTKVVMVK